MAGFLAVAIGVVALILARGELFYFDVTPKVAALLVAAAAVCLTRPGVADRRFSFLAALALASAALSTALASNPALSMYGSTWRRYGLVEQCAVLVVAWFIVQVADRATVVRGIAIASAAAAVYGIAQYFGYDPILPAAAYHVGEGVWTIVRPPGTFGYVSYFATWLLMAGFLCLSLRTTAGRAIAVLCWGAMLLTGTRAAVVGLAAGLLLWACRSGFRIGRRTVAGMALAVVAAGAFYVSPAGHNLRSRGRWFVEDPWGGARPLLWRDSLRMASAHLVVGHGPETFTPTFPHYESAELARAYPDFAHESPHNLFLDALVSQGMIGLLAMVAFCVVGVRSGDPWIAAAVAAGVVAQQFTVFTVTTALLFFVAIALGTGKSATAVRIPRFALAPVAAGFLIVAVRMWSADHALARTEQAVAAFDLAKADTQYRVYLERRLPGAAADLWYTRALFAASRNAPDALRRFQALRMAAATGSTAAARSEEPFNTWYTVANVRAALGDGAGTEEALRRAIAAKPNWFKSHWTLARLLQMEGRRAEALSEATAAAALDGGKDPEVAATLAELHAARD